MEIEILWGFRNGKQMKWKVNEVNCMESKWKVNNRGLLDEELMESNFDNLDYRNATDIANNSKGILRLYIYNENTKKYRYEYYFVEVIGNRYFGVSHHHTFKLKVLQVLNGTTRNVGDLISKNGKILYKNYFEIRKANCFYRDIKHKKKIENLINFGAELCTQ